MHNKHLMIALSLLLLFAMCKNKNNTIGVENIHNPATAEGISEEAKANMPVITFEKTTHDFGPVIQGERVSYTFKFNNTGKSNLIISSTSSTCGCTTSAPPQAPIKPGGTGEIKVMFDSKLKNGVVNNQVLVAANTYPATTLLRITADVKEP
ncbi:MAG: DUF1573 domain-containing protein [Bacteroidales bacterium]|jgi:hypothetical protein|nr:DUF1573 domain-containing protein [Bacteroidales bacterium]